MDKLISELYDRLSSEPALMPNFYMQIAYNEGVDRAVTDYISGMSDEFGTRLCEELFIPQKGHVLEPQRLQSDKEVQSTHDPSGIHSGGRSPQRY